jgi:hypothetical protein
MRASMVKRVRRWYQQRHEWIGERYSFRALRAPRAGSHPDCHANRDPRTVIKRMGRRER